MPKDPAILFYFDNWRGGTITMTRHLKGCYMDLLDAQFQSGHLSLDEIKVILGPDFSAWQTLQKKFKKDVDGNWFNERMELEILKRKSYSESRSKNRKTGKNNHMNEHMSNICQTHDDNIKIEIEIKDELKKGGPGENVVHAQKSDLSDIEIGKTIEFMHFGAQRNYTDNQIRDYWRAFIIHSEGKYYNDRQDEVNHFRNWLKKQPYATNSDSTPKVNKRNPGLSKLRAEVDAELNAGGKGYDSA